MTLQELAALQAGKTLQTKPAAAEKQEAKSEGFPFRGDYIALFAEAQKNPETGVTARAMRQIYDLHSLYYKYPPETPQAWETFNSIIAAISQEYGNPVIDKMLINVFESIEQRAAGNG